MFRRLFQYRFTTEELFSYSEFPLLSMPDGNGKFLVSAELSLLSQLLKQFLRLQTQNTISMLKSLLFFPLNFLLLLLASLSHKLYDLPCVLMCRK